MKPENVSSILLVSEKKSIEPTLLFQCATYWAEQGFKVVYIASSSFKTLPPLIHGSSSSLSDVFSQIRFMTLPRWQDLLRHLYSLHLFAQVPRVIIVDGLDEYCYPMTIESNRPHEMHDEEMHAALVCASLFDAAAACAKYTNQPAILIASCEKLSFQKLELIVDNFFSDLVWLIEPIGNNEKEIRITNIVSKEAQAQKTQLQFTTKSNDFIMLKKIVTITEQKVAENNL